MDNNKDNNRDKNKIMSSPEGGKSRIYTNYQALAGSHRRNFTHHGRINIVQLRG
jgi:hypothetical protein